MFTHLSRRLVVLFLALAMSLPLFLKSGYGLEKVVFTLDWVPYGRDAGFFAADGQGFFKEANLSVTILAGKGSGNSV